MRLVIIILLLSSLVFSLEAEIYCPASVKKDEVFTCSAKITNGSGTWDLKFDLTKKKKSIARIFDYEKGDFKSAFYYLKEFIKSGEKKEFKVKILTEGNFSGQVKFRQKGKVFEKNFSIEVFENLGANEKNKSNFRELNVEIRREVDRKVKEGHEVKKEEGKPKKSVLKPIFLGEEGGLKESFLDAKVIYESKDYKILRYSPYAFSLFLILLIFLLLKGR